MEIVLVIAAAGGLLGCFGSIVRLDLSKPKADAPRPMVRLAGR